MIRHSALALTLAGALLSHPRFSRQTTEAALHGFLKNHGPSTAIMDFQDDAGAPVRRSLSSLKDSLQKEKTRVSFFLIKQVNSWIRNSADLSRFMLNEK